MQKKKGISLIVLVITIIVIIILAAAIIISLNNSGIIGKAGRAVDEFDLQEVNHMASLAWSEAYLNGLRDEQDLENYITQSLTNNGVDTSKYVITVTTRGVSVELRNISSIASEPWVQDGNTITKGDASLEIGDLIQYSAGVSGYNGAWKVLGVEDGKLLIMSTEDVAELFLGELGNGINERDYGLLNGVARLNELCEPFGEGTGAIGARSIKEEDIDKIPGIYDKTTSRVGESNQYGNRVSFSWDTDDDGIINCTSTNGNEFTINTDGIFRYIDFNTMELKEVTRGQNNFPTLTNNYYAYSILDNEISLPNLSEKAKTMLFGELVPTYDIYYEYSSKYWLASYDIDTDEWEGEIEYGIKYVESGVRSTYLYTSNYSTNSAEYGVRAVVELSPNITIGEKDNTLGWSYTI